MRLVPRTMAEDLAADLPSRFGCQRVVALLLSTPSRSWRSTLFSSAIKCVPRSSFRFLLDKRRADSSPVPYAGSRLSGRITSGACTGGVPPSCWRARVVQLMHRFPNSSSFSTAVGDAPLSNTTSSTRRRSSSLREPRATATCRPSRPRAQGLPLEDYRPGATSAAGAVS